MQLSAEQVAAGLQAGGEEFHLQAGTFPLSIMYELCAVVVHHGWHASSGHYYAWVKESASPAYEEPETEADFDALRWKHRWRELNDNFVGEPGTFEEKVAKEQAYMLFYRPYKPAVVRAIACHFLTTAAFRSTTLAPAFWYTAATAASSAWAELRANFSSSPPTAIRIACCSLVRRS